MVTIIVALLIALTIVNVNKQDVYASEQLEVVEVKDIASVTVEGGGTRYFYTTYIYPAELGNAINKMIVEYYYMENAGVDQETIVNYLNTKYDIERLINKYGWWF